MILMMDLAKKIYGLWALLSEDAFGILWYKIFMVLANFFFMVHRLPNHPLNPPLITSLHLRHQNVQIRHINIF